MRRFLAALFLASMAFPLAAVAEATTITRRDGFLIIWNSIRRATQENREPYFTDVPTGSRGEEEITYAKYRGILDDDDPAFHPDDPLSAGDALLWLFRTRSVDDIDALMAENLPALLERYPVAFTPGKPLTEEEIFTAMRALDELLATEDHEVSLYSEKFHGKGTAFGETFDMHAMTAAHRTFPHNTLVTVTNLRNNKSVTVRINDRGPYVEGRDMDLSLGAFTAIEDRSRGILRATFKRLGDATLVSRCDDTDPRRAVRITKGVHLIGGIPATLSLGKELTLRSLRPFVVRAIRYPDGNVNAVQDWILPDEKYIFTASIEGGYVFVLGSVSGRVRELRMGVVRCSE